MLPFNPSIGWSNASPVEPLSAMRGRAREVGLEQVDGRQHRRHQRAQVGEELGQRVGGHADHAASPLVSPKNIGKRSTSLFHFNVPTGFFPTKAFHALMSNANFSS